MPFVSVDVDLSEIDTEELIEEIKSRKVENVYERNSDVYELIDQIYNLRRLGKNIEQELNKLIYIVIGKIV